MILEGFEIENWSCIRQLRVDALPPTGVVVLCGPNGTGKSSIVHALRAGLMDFPSTSSARDLKRWFPRQGSDKPKVSVTFRAQGKSWRVTKLFGTRESKLESRTPSGEWKPECTTASEAHERTLALVGGKASDAGLPQLLWLTQGEFRLPSAKDFDADVQSQLRGVLGVLQTPLDDRFSRRVGEEWSHWFDGRSKKGERPRLKKGCSLDKALGEMQKQFDELSRIDEEWRQFERMMRDVAELEVRALHLARQSAESLEIQTRLQDEYERSLQRLEAYRRAEQCLGAARKRLDDAIAARERRAELETEVESAQATLRAAQEHADDAQRQLHAAEESLHRLRVQAQGHQNARRVVQAQRDAVMTRQQALRRERDHSTARERLARADAAQRALEQLRAEDLESPAPTSATLKEMESNRTKANKLHAELIAAALVLQLQPLPGAAAAELAVDGAPAASAPVESNHAVRRRAELTIPDWGRIVLARGADARSIEQLEGDLALLDRQFRDAAAPFGVRGDDSRALDVLRGLASRKQLRDPEIQRVKADLDREAPHGCDVLRQEIASLEKLLAVQAPVDASLPNSIDALDKLASQLKSEFDANESAARDVEARLQAAEREIDGTSGLRQRALDARTRLVARETLVQERQLALSRSLTSEQLDREVLAAQESERDAQRDLDAARLSEDEETIRDRLDAARAAVRTLQSQLDATRRDLHQIEGALRLSEGLHPRRAAIAVRVAELETRTQRERLRADAFDRLHALFEECREKQLGAVMGPIHDRVLRWMRLLRIGGYGSIRFNDRFLPESLVSRSGIAELGFDEESTGTIEQMALMVRLALGATLSSPEDPMVAILDDPLTHSDVARLHQMRAVLRSAAQGDPQATPPAGPLQILVFTCHPEWFALESEHVIDLSKSEVMSRAPLA